MKARRWIRGLLCLLISLVALLCFAAPASAAGPRDIWERGEELDGAALHRSLSVRLLHTVYRGAGEVVGIDVSAEGDALIAFSTGDLMLYARDGKAKGHLSIDVKGDYSALFGETGEILLFLFRSEVVLAVTRDGEYLSARSATREKMEKEFSRFHDHVSTESISRVSNGVLIRLIKPGVFSFFTERMNTTVTLFVHRMGDIYVENEDGTYTIEQVETADVYLLYDDGGAAAGLRLAGVVAVLFLLLLGILLLRYLLRRRARRAKQRQSELWAQERRMRMQRGDACGVPLMPWDTEAAEDGDGGEMP